MENTQDERSIFNAIDRANKASTWDFLKLSLKNIQLLESALEAHADDQLSELDCIKNIKVQLQEIEESYEVALKAIHREEGGGQFYLSISRKFEESEDGDPPRNKDAEKRIQSLAEAGKKRRDTGYSPTS